MSDEYDDYIKCWWLEYYLKKKGNIDLMIYETMSLIASLSFTEYLLLCERVPKLASLPGGFDALVKPARDYVDQHNAEQR